MVGSGFPYAEFLPLEGQARAIQVDIDPEQLSIRYPVELGLVGDRPSVLEVVCDPDVPIIPPTSPWTSSASR